MLESMGIDRQTERVYRGMIEHPNKGVVELASILGYSQGQIRKSLDQLSTLALVQPSERANSGFRALNPEAAMELLLARQHAELATLQLQVETSRAAAAQMVAELATSQPATLHKTEYLAGQDVIRQRLADLGRGVEQEVMTFASGGAHSDADLAASRGPNADLLKRGVRIRTIYLDSIRHHQPTLDHVTWLSNHGGQVPHHSYLARANDHHGPSYSGVAREHHRCT